MVDLVTAACRRILDELERAELDELEDLAQEILRDARGQSVKLSIGRHRPPRTVARGRETPEHD